MIVSGETVTGDLTLDTDAVVVGSGAGGAVVAALLAEAGIGVIAFEEGGHFEARHFTQREHEMYPLLYRLGGNQTTDDQLITVMQGRCVGGSTVINMADCTPIPVALFDHWRRRTGSRIQAAHLDDSYRRVRASLGVTRLAGATINENNAILSRYLARTGARGGVFDSNRLGCIGAGFCMVGCSYNAKKAAHLTYIPRASTAGATIYADCRAERVIAGRRGVEGVEAWVIDRATRARRHRISVSARAVVIAAGAIHSPLLLLRSGLGNDNGLVGKNLSLQPQAPITALYDRTIDVFAGIPQTVYCDEWETASEEIGISGFRLETIGAGPAMAATVLGGFGLAHKAFMSQFRRVAAMVALVPDRPSGEVAPGDDGEAVIRYCPTEEYLGRLRAGMKAAARVFLEDGAGGIVVPCEDTPPLRSVRDLDAIDKLVPEPGRMRLLSAHPQGTCRLGASPATSVVNEDLESHFVRNLFVIDASIFPSTSSTHTMIPTMVMADRAAHRLLARRAELFGKR
ncbi:MAG: GMC family oxidoreductase [Candidatus Schekmanbacteria bacterium]|nr:GMC family oxidoreductase [Candidatus Schekmanbacteria bacterium]